MNDAQTLHADAPEELGSNGARLLPGPWLAKLLVAVAVAVAVASGLSAWVLSQYQERAFTRQLLEQQTSDIEVLAKLVSSKLDQSQKVLASVADGLGAWTTGSRPAVDWLVQQGLPVARYFDSIVIAVGSKVFRLNLRFGKGAEDTEVDPAERDVLKRTMVQGKPLISAPVQSDSTAAGMVFSMPLLDKSGVQRGALAGVLRLQSQGLLPPAAESGLVIMTADGLILAHPDQTRVLGQARDEPSLQRALAWWRKQDAAGMPAQTHVFGTDVVSMAEIAPADWLLVRLVQRGDPWVPMASVQFGAWWLVAGLALAVGLIAGAWVWMHARRLRQLHGMLARNSRHGGDELQLIESAYLQLSAEQARHAAVGAQQQRLMDTWVEQAQEGVLLLQGDRVVRCGWALARSLGYEERELRSQPLGHWLLEPPQMLRQAWRTLHRQGYCRVSVRVLHKRGEPMVVRVRAFSVDAQPTRRTLCFVQGVECDSPRSSAVLPLDALTQLPNYPALLEQVSLALVAQGQQQDSEPSCVLLYANVDNMSAINATSGRAAGDQVLKYVADQIQLLWPHHGWAARVSGDKLACLLRACSTEQAMGLAQRLCNQMHRWQPRWQDARFPITLSIGLVPVSSAYPSAEALVRASDLACYQAKRAGGNGVHFNDCYWHARAAPA